MTRSIKTLIIAQMLRSFNFATPISTLFLLKKGFSIQQILLLASVILISGMIFEIPTGVLGDRYGRKWSMVVGAFLSVVGWALWLYVEAFWGFTFVYILFGLANAFWSGSDQALIYDELKAVGKEEQAQKIFSRYNGAIALAFAIAALVCGLITQVHTLEAFYLLYIMTLIASVLGFLVSLFISEAKHTTYGTELSHQTESGLKQFFSGILLLKNNRKLFKITFFSIFTLSFALMDLYQVYFVQAKVPEAWYGYVLAFSSIMIAVTKWYAYKLEEWFGVETSMKMIAIVPAVLWGLMAITFQPAIAMALFIFNDVGGNVRDPIIADYQNRHIQGANRATVLSTISLITNGYIAVMLPIIGWLADWNLSIAFLVCGGIILLGNLGFRIKSTDVLVA